MNRREFILMGTSVAALPSVGLGNGGDPAVCLPEGEARLKVGILSDVHVTNRTPGMRDSNEYLRKALRYFDAEKDETMPVRCRFARASLPAGRDVRFVITPYNCWMKPGNPIVSEWFRA